MVLIDRAVDDGDLALAECVVERIVDLCRSDAEPRCGGAVDDKVRFETFLIEIRIYIDHHRAVLQRLNKARCPSVEVIHAVRLECVLILGVALPAAGADVLNSDQKQITSGDLGELRPQSRDHLLDWRTLRQRL